MLFYEFIFPNLNEIEYVAIFKLRMFLSRLNISTCRCRVIVRGRVGCGLKDSSTGYLVSYHAIDVND